jgi:hypothetical protein
MVQDQFIEQIDQLLRTAGSVVEAGEEYAQPPLEVLRYYRRVARLNRLPFVGKALSVACVLRQPIDVAGARADYQQLLTRLAMAVNGRFPPWRGFVIGLSTVVVTPEPIEPGDDGMLRDALEIRLRRMRVVPLGLFRVNLAQEAVALALKTSPEALFTEPAGLADFLTEHFRRYVPPLEV